MTAGARVQQLERGAGAWLSRIAPQVQAMLREEMPHRLLIQMEALVHMQEHVPRNRVDAAEPYPWPCSQVMGQRSRGLPGHRT